MTGGGTVIQKSTLRPGGRNAGTGALQFKEERPAHTPDRQVSIVFRRSGRDTGRLYDSAHRGKHLKQHPRFLSRTSRQSLSGFCPGKDGQ